MCKPVQVFCAVILTIVSAASAHGSAIAVANASFESPPGAPSGGEYTFSSQSQATDAFVTGWGIITSNPVGEFSPGGVLPNLNGLQAAFIQGSAGNELYQDVGQLRANTTYTLTVAMAGNLTGTQSQAVGSIQLVNQAGIDGPTTPLSPIVTTSATQGLTLTDYSTSFTTGPVVANDLAIVLGFAPSVTGGNNPQIYYDNVRLSATPEPSSCILSGLGAVGLVVAARRRRKAWQR